MCFSIITPTFNCCATLAIAIQSVLDQKGIALEYIIIDGGSTDGTVDLIREAASEDARIRWISEPDKGIADAFNRGIKLSKGEWIGILAADDRYAPNALALVAERLGANSAAAVVHGDLLRLDEQGRPLFTIAPSNLEKTIWHQMPVNHPATFVSRRAYERVGPFDVSLKIAMDYDLILRLYKLGARFEYINKPLAHMRYGGVSDNRLLTGLKEVRKITIREGYPTWKANYWLGHRFVLETTKKLLRRFGLHSMMKLHPRFKGV